MLRSAIAVLAVVLISSVALAEIPQVIGYQGRVTDNSGVPVSDGTYTMRFRIYTAETGGSWQWDSNNQSVAVAGGIFNVMLGESPQPALTLAFGQDYWLLVTFAGQDQTPRKRLASVGYAYMASGLVPGTEVSGSVTTGTYAAVKGVNTATTGPAYGVMGESASPNGRGIFGLATYWDGTTYGGFFESQSGGGAIGVGGLASVASGASHGVLGQSVSSEGTGVRGVATATSGSTTGGFFQTASSGGTGVQGEGDYRGGRFKDTDSDNYCYAGYSTYKTYGTGTNAFVQNHPWDKDRTIVYAAPEGDEVATYTRGTARLVDGEARVPLGETFKWVTNPEIGLTAHLTPRGEAVPLAVVLLTTEELVVRGPKDRPDDLAFDYIVYGLRIGFEEVSIVQEKQEESYIPSMEDHQETYAKHPELRPYNALERFRGMHADAYGTDPAGRGAAERLRDAVGEYDATVHGSLDEGREARTRAAEELVRLERERLRDERERARLQRGLPSDQSE
jgi:hypothetical protein